ncbi:Hypothetical protein DPCES_3447 [Desulfitobacterium hafniense]|uniref:Uncharacterized protein n=1 Tax=Desulfitobacterium hafniense TaxID=49338 RepID=A0A098B389_DESHA|nr:hypothetical protein [Desulfitobacterium hafniense]CDX03333.1 Hypothetical protein DPCES_3447 [Desulfitobacterium hafniense]
MAKKTESLDQALGRLPMKYRMYFRWKFNIPYKGQEVKERTVEQLLKASGVANMSTFEAWEKTEEYEYLVNLMLAGKEANDLLEVYNAVSEKAKAGDSKAVDTLFKIQKTIKDNLKRTKLQEQEVQEEDDLLL